MFLSGKIVTTRAKAKAVQGEIEKFVTLSKKGDLASRRRALARLDNKLDATKALFENVGPSFAKRQSGFTRIIALPRRVGDNAKMVRVEWTETITIKKEEPKVKKVKKVVKPKKVVKVEKKAIVKKVSKKPSNKVTK
jgi:large subunit ribosomal protein L17